MAINFMAVKYQIILRYTSFLYCQHHQMPYN